MAVDFTGTSVDGKCYCVILDKARINGNIHTTCGGIIAEEKLKEVTKETKRRKNVINNN